MITIFRKYFYKKPPENFSGKTKSGESFSGFSGSRKFRGKTKSGESFSDITWICVGGSYDVGNNGRYVDCRGCGGDYSSGFGESYGSGGSRTGERKIENLNGRTN